jgi:Domain of unknown function (DUF4177)
VALPGGEHRSHRLPRGGIGIYSIINIGASFSNKDRKRLEETINSYGEQGWRFHSVFTVESRGCLGLFRQTTNFMVLEAAWARAGESPQVSPPASPTAFPPPAPESVEEGPGQHG